MTYFFMSRVGLILSGVTGGDPGPGPGPAPVDLVFSGPYTPPAGNAVHLVFPRIPGYTSPFTGSRYYFEVAYSSTETVNANGYIGVSGITAFAGTYAETNNAILAVHQCGYRGNGTIWSANDQRIAGLPTYANGDVVMCAFDTETLGFWVGKNGTWVTDPATDDPVYTLQGGDPTGRYYAHAQGRGTGDGGTLNGTSGEFLYPLPAGCRPIFENEAASTTHEAFRDPGYTFSNGYRTWVNTSGNNDFRRQVASKGFLDAGVRDTPIDATATQAGVYLGGAFETLSAYSTSAYFSGNNFDALSFSGAAVWIELET